MKPKVFTTTLKIDVDLLIPKTLIGEWKRSRAAILASLSYDCVDVVLRPSDSRKGFHAFITLLSTRKLSEKRKCELQFLLGDDQKRCDINFNRIRLGVKRWNKLFSRVGWRSELSPQCKKCWLRKRIKLTLKKKKYLEAKAGVYL